MPSATTHTVKPAAMYLACFLLLTILTSLNAHAEDNTATTIKAEEQTDAQEQTTAAPMPAMDHSHMPIVRPEQAPALALSLKLEVDAMDGYNLSLLIIGLQIGPPPSNTSMPEMMQATMNPETGEVLGHAHLYINGEKIGRLYGRHHHLPSTLLKEGVNQITVTLNNHGHMYWTQDERKVLATLFLKPAIAPEPVYRFESFPIPLQNAEK